jgi:hypothetical protein
MTRSVSRAISIDRDDPPPPVQQQVVKRARSRRLSTASEISEVDVAPTPKGKRTTRAAASGVSPTPSVRSTRAGSQTPRKSTRVKK